MTDASTLTAEDPWVACMRRGDFAGAWVISDAVLRRRSGTTCSHWPRHQQFVWNGTYLHGRRVLVRCYHGLGDTVQFIRYAPALAAVAREVTYWVQPKLLPLLKWARGVERLWPLHEGSPAIEYDVDVEIMELPHVFRTTLADLPTDTPYLHPPKRHRTRRPGLAVGIAWRSGPWNSQRDVPLSLFANVARLSGVRLHALQFDLAPHEWPGSPDTVLAGDPLETAQAVAALDLIISVDSFPAHLGGALGIPVWTLLPHDADWRWMSDRRDTPWYPSMRLFRQQKPGQWGIVMDEVVQELTRMLQVHDFAPQCTYGWKGHMDRQEGGDCRMRFQFDGFGTLSGSRM